jgi:K+-transporting ATPase ATPase A chain
MTWLSYLQIGVYLCVLILLSVPLGIYMAKVYEGKYTILSRVLQPIEKPIFKLAGIQPEMEMGWKTYTFALLLFNLIGFVIVFLLHLTPNIWELFRWVYL